VNFFRKFAIIKNTVLPIKAIPGNPVTKEIPGLGNPPALIKANTVNAIATYIGICVSLLKNGRAIKNKESGMLKYWIPPHDAFASPSIMPPANAFGIAYLTSLCFIAERNR